MEMDKILLRRFRARLILLALIFGLFYFTIPLFFQLSPTAPDAPANTNDDADVFLEELSQDDQILMKLDEKLTGIEDRLYGQSSLLHKLEHDMNESDNKIQQLTEKNKLDKATIERLGKLLHETEHAKPLQEEPIKSSSSSNQLTNTVVKKVFPSLLPTSIYCQGSTKADRVCRFHNLYYYPKRDVYFAVLTHQSILHNVPVDRSPCLLELTTIEGHTVFYFDYEEVSEDTFTDVLVNVVEKRTFLFSRFHLANIMHTLHDDFLGLYHTIRRFAPADTSNSKPPYAAFSLDHYIQFWDKHHTGSYGKIFEMLSDHPLRYYSDLKADDLITCFSDIVVGIAKQANWYQYGFIVPQGPIKDKFVNGNHVREAAQFIEYQLGISDDQKLFAEDPFTSLDTLVIFSRTENRLILNEKELMEDLSQKYNLKPQFVRMEDLDFKSQIQILQKTKIALGMHGSLLIMAMFMRPGSILIECYPYAVPAENYTPYRTMAQLPGMNIAYRAWVNTHEDANFAHPDNSLYHGGIRHLPEDEQKKILETKTVPKHLCCTDPYWLFRIYQDTRINQKEIEELVADSVAEIESKNFHIQRYTPILYPSRVEASSVTCKVIADEEDKTKLKGVLVRWNHPWNGVIPEKYLVWEHISFSETSASENSVLLSSPSYQNQTVLQIWIKTEHHGVESKYNDKAECRISL